jgi:hypothetical protein
MRLAAHHARKGDSAMKVISLPILRRILAGLLLAVALLTAGCIPAGMVWLPDSSGFIYPSGKNLDSISFYDVAKREHRVLVKDTGATTLFPAFSPDGKRIAVARLRCGGNQAGIAQVVIYDWEGKELHRSPEINWSGASAEPKERQPLGTILFWDPTGKKLLVSGAFQSEPRSGIYDPATKQMKMVDGQLMAFGSTPVCPDGKGFLVGDFRTEPEVALVGWDGKRQKVALDAEATDNDERKFMLYYPWSFLSRWDSDTAKVAYKQWRIRLDTKKLKGALENLPATEARVDKDFLQQHHAFADGVKVRALDVENAEGKFEKSRLEIITPGAEKPRVVMDGEKGLFGFSPSPDKKLLAIWCVGPQGTSNSRVYIVDSKGELVSEVTVGGSK